MPIGITLHDDGGNAGHMWGGSRRAEEALSIWAAIAQAIGGCTHAIVRHQIGFYPAIRRRPAAAEWFECVWFRPKNSANAECLWRIGRLHDGLRCRGIFQIRPECEKLKRTGLTLIPYDPESIDTAAGRLITQGLDRRLRASLVTGALRNDLIIEIEIEVVIVGSNGPTVPIEETADELIGNGIHAIGIVIGGKQVSSIGAQCKKSLIVALGLITCRIHPQTT